MRPRQCQAELFSRRLQALQEQGMALAEAQEKVQGLMRDMHKILGERPVGKAQCYMSATALGVIPGLSRESGVDPTTAACPPKSRGSLTALVPVHTAGSFYSGPYEAPPGCQTSVGNMCRRVHGGSE